MSYSTTKCRKCDKETYTNLENYGYLCASCLKEINTPIQTINGNKEEQEVDLKKGVRWLQAWLFVESVDLTSVLVSWLPPEFLTKSKPQIDEYYVYTEGGEVSKIVAGESTQVLFEHLRRDHTYKFYVKGLVKGKFISAELKKNYYLR
ncbi:MAG: hypothetical protein CBD98_003890 [Flavobacteriaceae bacterium TMED238]|nr:MAG: hypothetical protein CBD98_003890 [Flavobacteriaceae bacterium TMED238]|tara:strand:+ start:1496 stop:1939 length:444 start_codon:yes stop_codon:yes gene_type:complete